MVGAVYVAAVILVLYPTAGEGAYNKLWDGDFSAGDQLLSEGGIVYTEIYTQ